MVMHVAYKWKGTKRKELTNAVTDVIAKYSLSIYTVEKRGFKRLLRTFDPRYKLPVWKMAANRVKPI